MGAKLTIAGLIGLGCIAAAAGGGYLALRSNAADLRLAPVNEPAQSASSTPPGDVAPAAAPTSAEAAVAAPTRVPDPAKAAARPTQIPADTRSIVNETSTPPAQSAVSVAVGSAEPQPALSAPSVVVASPTPTPAPPVAQTQTLAPPAPKYDEVTVTADAVLGLRLDSTISSETTRVEDRVNARLLRDVLVDGRVALASGSRLEGIVTQVDRGGKFKDRPRLGITFNTIVMADGTRVAIQTDTIFREGESPSGQANAKVGGSAVVGAILGAMLGGKKGAILGSTAGAAGGAAAVAAGDRAEAVMTTGTQLTVRLTAPVTVLIERDHERDHK